LGEQDLKYQNIAGIVEFESEYSTKEDERKDEKDANSINQSDLKTAIGKSIAEYETLRKSFNEIECSALAQDVQKDIDELNAVHHRADIHYVPGDADLLPKLIKISKDT